MGNAGSSMGFHVLQMHLCFTVDPHAAASPWLHHGLQRNKSLLQHLEHVFFLPLHWPWGLQSCCCHIFSLLSPSTVLQWIFPLNYVILDVLPPLLQDLASSIFPLGLAWGKLLGASHRNHPLFPHYLNLAMQTQSTIAQNISRNMQM